MKRLILFVAAMWAFGVSASVSEVRHWKPEPGRAAEMYQAAAEARAIQERLGASVFIGTDQNGNLIYVLTFPDWGAWAAFGKAMQADKAWAAFIEKFFVANPNSTNFLTAYLDTPVVAKTLPVSAVYSWDILPGKFDAFMAVAQEAVTIHNALGASAGINIDELGNVHYELTFDSWASWAKFGAAVQKSEAYTALVKKANLDPSAELVKVYLIDTYTGP